MHQQPRRTRSGRADGRRLSTTNELFVAFDHTARGKGLERLRVDNPALRQAAAAVLRAVRNDRLPVYVSSGWVLLPPTIAAALSPLSFDLERRVLNHYPRPELPAKLQSTASASVIRPGRAPGTDCDRQWCSSPGSRTAGRAGS